MLDVEERSLDELVASLSRRSRRRPAAPVRPRLPTPALLRGDIEWQPCCEKGPVIVGELELVLPLDASELGIGQARPDFVAAGLGQPAGGFLAQPCRFAADHFRTVAAGACGSGSAALSRCRPPCSSPALTSFVLTLARCGRSTLTAAAARR